MARKSRKNLPQPEQAAASALLPELEEAKMPAAIYGRLSVEDEETEESMETQIALVQDYINRSRELSYVDTYFDNVQNPVYRAKGEIMSLTDKVSQMAKKREQLYADYVAGVVDSEDYQLIREDYSRQYDGLRAALQEAENKKAEVERQIEEYLNMTSHLEEHLDNFEFDIQLVKSLVQKIEVSADKRIRIVFGFQDVFTEFGKESAET